MKRLYLIAAMFLMLVTCGAMADTYFRGNIVFPVYDKLTGNIFKRPDFKVFGTAAIGAKINSTLSLELEGIYRQCTINYSNLTGTTVIPFQGYAGLVNALIHPETFSYNSAQFFMGLGLGYSRNKSSLQTGSSSGLGPVSLDGEAITNNLIAQAILGVAYKVNKQLAITSDARWVYFNKIQHKEKITGYVDTEYLSSIVLTIGAKTIF